MGEDAWKPAQGKVSFGYIHQRPGGGEGRLSWTTSAGIRIELTTLYLVAYAVELHRCLASQSWWEPLLWSRAMAHVPNAANRMGTPVVLDLLAAPGKARIMDEIGPPLGRYCALVVVHAPADEDVVNLTGRREALEGRTALIEGRWRATEAGDWREFTIRPRAPKLSRIELEPALQLREPGAQAMILIETVLRVEDLRAIDARPDAPAAFSEAVLEVLLKSQRRYGRASSKEKGEPR